MDEIYLTIFFITILLFFLGSGIWVALSMIGVSTIGMMLFTTRPVGDAMATIIWGTTSSWTLAALPLFVWMGEILFRTNLSENLFKGLAPWLSRLPGSLLHVNILGCAIFAAISGSSAATVATVGKMSIPELRKRKYPEKIIIGTLAGSGTLGLLIPPSIILIIYGVTVEESISKLFVAGIIPGIFLAFLFMSYVIVWSLLNKTSMPPVLGTFSFTEKNIKYLWCKSEYPTFIEHLKGFPKNFKTPIVGYSDHCIGIETCLIAISRGAKIIEKHFTLDKSENIIRDHALSATPEEFRQLVNLGIDIEKKINLGV